MRRSANMFGRAALVMAGCLALVLGLPGVASAAGYWRYVNTEISPTKEQLASPGPDEKRVSGAFQPDGAGRGTVELYFKSRDANQKTYISRVTFTFGSSSGMQDLKPGEALAVDGSLSFTSNFPGASATGKMAVNNGDYFLSLAATDEQGASGGGSFTVPNGSPNDTLRIYGTAYLAAEGALIGTVTNYYEWAEGMPPQTNPSPSGSNGGFGGVWSTSEGDMTLEQSGAAVTGTYSQDNGRIMGDVSSGHLVGYWGEDSSGSRCETERMGTYYWGRIDWVLSDAGDGFAGGWSYCEGEPGSTWSGQRIAEQ